MKTMIWGVTALLYCSVLQAQVPTSSVQPTSSYGEKVIADLPIEKYLPSEQDQQDLFDNFRGSALWEHWKPEDKAQVTYPKEADGTTGLVLVNAGPGWERTAILTVPQDVVRQITGRCYGITGEVSYSGVKRGALSMVSCFARGGLTAPMDVWYSDQEGKLWGAKDDAMGLMEGTRDWGNFYLGFDRGHADLTLKHIVFNILLEGPGTVYLRNIRLVQYPDAPAAQTPAAPSIASAKIHELIVNLRSSPDHGTMFSVEGTDYTDIAPVQQLLRDAHAANPNVCVVIRSDKDVKYDDIVLMLDAAKFSGITSVAFATKEEAQLTPSTPPPLYTLEQVGAQVEQQRLSALRSIWFCLGVATTGLTLLIGGGIIFISRRWSRRRHERELRRIASMDS